MSVLDELASALGRRDEVPNQELAARLVAESEQRPVAAEIGELVGGLESGDKAVRNDCIKVLYEIGYLKPELIEDYVEAFVALLGSRENRLVWGGMTALGSIAPRQARAVWPHVDTVIETTRKGSVITQDWGVRVLAALAAADGDYAEKVWPFLLDFVRRCRPKDVARHAESVAVAATNEAAQAALAEVLEGRLGSLKPAARKRVEKVLKGLVG